MLNLKFKQNRYHFDPLENLAHNLKLRRIIENGIVAIFKQWKKLTAATSFDHELQKLSYKKAAEYALNNFNNASYFPNKSQLYQYIQSEVVSRTNTEHIHAEFGVFKGQSINYFADCNHELRWYGFDSFEGLPEDWSGNGKMKEHFTTAGELPKVRQNVTLIAGLFEITLPQWVSAQNKPFAFLHLDADLYSSTKQVLDIASSYIDENTLFLFDEYFGYVGWENGEHKAWIEWLTNKPFLAECVAYAGNGTALFRLIKKHNK